MALSRLTLRPVTAVLRPNPRLPLGCAVRPFTARFTLVGVAYTTPTPLSFRPRLLTTAAGAKRSGADLEQKLQYLRSLPKLLFRDLVPKRQHDETADQQVVAKWLFFCAGLVFLVIVVGGITRLTESGLSITEWRPVAGALPPLSAEEWQREFDLYVQSPEFLKQRDPATFTMADFKFIFFWEWAHRQLGRFVGVTYALPWLYFSSRGMIPRRLQPRMAGLLGLIGLQGAIGWVMVASGLDSKNFDDGSRVRVSHYRLTLHLMAALTLYSGFLWTAMGLYRPHIFPGLAKAAPTLRTLAQVTTGWTLFTVASGGLVAGLDAGLVYNEWPTMGGSLLPLSELYLLTPRWRSALDHDVTVQFHHRMFAYVTLALVAALSVHGARAPLPPPAAWALRGVQAAVLLQATLGVLTVLYGAPVELASAHQGGSVVLLTALWALTFSLRATHPLWL